MKFLVIGGTSFIGPCVVRQLHELGHKVTVFHRGNTEPDFPSGVNRIYGDRNELERHSESIARLEPEVVIDMVCFTEAQVAGLLVAVGNVAQRIVLASSCDVYQAYGKLIGVEQGEPGEIPLTEDSPLRSSFYPYRSNERRADDDPKQWLDDYDKIPCEQAILEAPYIEGSVVRLPMVYGENDKQVRTKPYLEKMAANESEIVLDADSAAWQAARGYVENVALAITLAATKPEAANRVYNIGDPDPLCELDWLKLIAKITGWNGKVVSPPLADLPEDEQPGHDPRHHLFASSKRIRDELGYCEPVAFDKAVKRTVAWQLGNMG